jgi:hypothetical protein
MFELQERKKQIWSNYNINNKEYFDFILQFMEYFSERWCENFYNHFSINRHISSYKFVKFTKKLNSILNKHK